MSENPVDVLSLDEWVMVVHDLGRRYGVNTHGYILKSDRHSKMYLDLSTLDGICKAILTLYTMKNGFHHEFNHETTKLFSKSITHKSYTFHLEFCLINYFYNQTRAYNCAKLFRGTYAPFNSHGKLTFRFNKFSSCSEDESVALKFVNNGGTLYVILDAESVNIQPHSQFLAQKEHLIHPTTEFIVEGVEDNVLKWGMKSGRGSYYALTLVTLRAIRETPTVVPSLSHSGQATPRPQMITVNLDVKTPKPLETNYDLIVIDDSTLNPSLIVTAKLDPGKSLGAIISSPDRNRMSGSNINGTKPPSSMGKNYDSIVREIVSTAPPVKPIAIAPSAQPITTTPSAQPITTTPSTQPITTTPSAQPIITTPSAQPITTTPSAQPITTTPSAQPITTTPSAQPITTTPSAQPIITTPSAQPITVVPRAIDSVRPLSDHENSVRVHITDEENTKADQGSNWISCLLGIFCCCSQ